MKHPEPVSMMAPRPEATAEGDLAQALARLHRALLASVPQAHAGEADAAARPLPVVRAQALQALCRHLADNALAAAGQGAGGAPLQAFSPHAMQEGLALAEAAGRQWWALQAQWVDGLATLAEEAGELREANTVSKFAEQQMNLAQQGLALLSGQVTRSALLFEQLQNNTAWWLSRQRDAPPG